MTTNYQIRINIVFLIMLSVFLVLIGNLYVIQIRRGNFFESMGRSQYSVVITATPPRAEIFDRHGRPLTVNMTHLTAFIIPTQLKEPAKTKAFLAKYYPQAFERLERYADNHFMYIKRHLSEQDLKLIERSKLVDINFLKEPSRFYPYEAFGALIGMTDSDNKGLFGIEAAYNHILGGSTSSYFLEQDARSGHFYFNRETKIQGGDGKPIALTIDATLQSLAYDELKEAVQKNQAREGMVLALNPVNGDILVMAQYPGIDSNAHGEVDLEKTKNKIVTEAYELGSVMKVFLALAALDDGVVAPDEIIDCGNAKSAYIDGFKVNTHRPHGKITFSEVIELSNNIGTSKVAQRLGTRLYDYYVRCGFGKKTGLDWAGEQKGVVNPPSTWSKRSIFSLSFGYEIRTTLLQLACAFSLITTGGRLVVPRLILQPDTPICAPLSSRARTRDPFLQPPLYKPETLETMRDILKKTVLQGTAHRAKIDGYDIFGKTGTACLLVDGHYDQDRNIFTFAGLTEKGSYKRVIVTFIKEVPKKDVTAASVAVPLFDRIARKMLIHEKVI